MPGLAEQVVADLRALVRAQRPRLAGCEHREGRLGAVVDRPGWDLQQGRDLGVALALAEQQRQRSPLVRWKGIHSAHGARACESDLIEPTRDGSGFLILGYRGAGMATASTIRSTAEPGRCGGSTACYGLEWVALQRHRGAGAAGGARGGDPALRADPRRRVRLDGGVDGFAGDGPRGGRGRLHRDGPLERHELPAARHRGRGGRAGRRACTGGAPRGCGTCRFSDSQRAAVRAHADDGRGAPGARRARPPSRGRFDSGS